MDLGVDLGVLHLSSHAGLLNPLGKRALTDGGIARAEYGDQGSRWIGGGTGWGWA